MISYIIQQGNDYSINVQAVNGEDNLFLTYIVLKVCGLFFLVQVSL